MSDKLNILFVTYSVGFVIYLPASRLITTINTTKGEKSVESGPTGKCRYEIIIFFVE